MYKVIIFLIISLDCYAQNILLEVMPVKDSKVYFSKVLEVKSIKSSELYSRAKRWSKNYSDNFKEVNSSQNNELIEYQGFFKELWGPNDYPELYVDVFYTVKFKFRNERYQYEISNFIVKKSNTAIELEIYKMKLKKNIKYNKIFYKRIDEHVKKVTNSIEKTMNK